MRSPKAVSISVISLTVTGLAALFLPLTFPAKGMSFIAFAAWAPVVAILALLAFWAQSWRVAIRGTRGDVSISMALDVASMLLFHPFIAAGASALGTTLYQGLVAKPRQHWLIRTVVRGIVTFAAVALGGWAFRMLRPYSGPLLFKHDWLAVGIGIGMRLGLRALFYPLGMAALRPDPVWQQVRAELERLPLVPFLLTTTLGGTAAVVWQAQPYAIILLVGPLTATWAATNEFKRLNELLATMEDKVADRTVRLAETVKDRERRLAEFEALNAVGRAMVQAIHPDEVLRVIAWETAWVTGATSTLVTLLSEDKQRQFVRAAFGEALTPYIGLELPLVGNLSGLVIRTGEVQFSTDPQHDPRLNQSMTQAGNWQHVIEAPLLVKDRVLGVLIAASSAPNAFDQQHIRLLSLFANQAGIFLENARLHEKEREVAILEERNRLARELHDSVTQVLFSMTLNLEAAAGLLETKPAKAAVMVTRSQEMASEALAEMRSLIFELRPSALQEKGLAAALANHINLFRRRYGVEVSLTLEGEERLPPEKEFCFYRVAQEALNNVAKHARARQAAVRYAVEDGTAVLMVRDDGVGFDPAEDKSAQSFGMIGMQERLTAVGGTLAVESAPGQGTCVTARIPISTNSLEE